MPSKNMALLDLCEEVSKKLHENDQNRLNVEVGCATFEKHLHDFFHPKNIFNMTRNFPICPVNANAARVQAEKLFLENKELDAAKLFLLSQANTFQHQVLLQYSKRLSKQGTRNAKNEVNSDPDVLVDDCDGESFDEQQKRLMLFQSFDKTDVIDRMSSLPSNWTVVQIIAQDPAITRFKNTKKDLPISNNVNPDLMLVQLQTGKVRVRLANGPNSLGCTAYLKEFQSILAENTHINRNVKEKDKYTVLRKETDNRLEALLKSLEDEWLAHQKTLLFGILKEEKDIQLVKSFIKEEMSGLSSDILELERILSASPFLSKKQIYKGIKQYLSSSSEDEIMRISRSAIKKLHGLKMSPRHPVILICDATVQSLPWESLPSLKSCCQAMSRVPSLPFLHALWAAHNSDDDSVVKAGVAQDSVFYLVNPDKSLPDTQKRMDKAFQAWEQWEGIAGQEPSKGQLEKVLQGKDAFMYCGHGSGSKYLSGDEIQKLKVRAVPCLLGCSSGQLNRLGRTIDPLGTAQSYLLAASPGLIGFLWPVTDADVDQWTVTFINHWLGGGENELLQAVADKRKSFKYIMNGSALVVYGLPLSAKHQNK